MSWRWTWKALVYLYDRFFDDGFVNEAASLAYSTLLTLVPVLLLSFAILSLFPIFHGVGDRVQDFILQNFIATSREVIAQQINKFVSQLRDLTWTNFAMLLIISMLMIYNMVHAFNRIWKVKMERHLAISFLIYIVVLVVSPFAFGVLLVLSSYLASLPAIGDFHLPIYVRESFLFMLPYVSAFVTFTFFNWVLPSAKVKLRYALIAGAITTVFFEAAKSLFVLYLQYFPTYRIIYGALATIPIFLIWIFLTWTLVLIGGLICHLLQERPQFS